MTIITMPTRYHGPHGAQDVAVPADALFLPSAAGRALLAAIEAETRGGAAGCEQPVARLLAEGLVVPDLLASLVWREEVGDRPARLDLAQTRSFRVFARRWQPGQFGPLRRFMDWFAFGVVEGRLVELDCSQGQAADPAGVADGMTSLVGHAPLSAGEVRHGPGDGQRLRRLANLSTEIALSLHVEGLPQAPTAVRSAIMPVPSGVQPARRAPPRLLVIPGGRTD